jgi:DNA-directed RNA polymerase specialized sigma24 family protein
MAHDEEHWSAWLAEHGPALVLLARQWVSGRADAEDAVQEAFVRAWKARERLADPIIRSPTCTPQ